MEVTMKMDEVLAKIAQLQKNGESLSKKKIKQAYPELLQNALYYFPSWEHAIQQVK
ncbi:hypothetical protein [Thermoflavimicrobium dichotomicum]|uniref:Uncharacterized protein n=1 Tax=Thermoflavimicrobium dichotomicum TaxID=46223 RepID=A0A1I3PVM5_9BACL|nr:hypothetical protein [Thermoflavimicrobium dichotomicum]SFJ25337.1 hypothetical protein SAMN05421852_106131 [Thermoflavimicrobium dichotomicum]